MSDRLYIINTETKEYLTIAKDFHDGYDLGNVHLLERFLKQVLWFQTRYLKLISEHDVVDLPDWESYTNFNTENEWVFWLGD